MIHTILSGDAVYLQLVRFVIALGVGVLLTKAVLMPATRRLVSRRGSKKAAHSMENLVGISGLFLALLIALQAASFGNLLSVLGALAAAATVAIGFGMRDQVASVVAGVFIHTDNPFVKGDYLKVQDIEGKVKEIRLRTTSLSTGAGEKIVPNNVLTTSVLQNLSRGTRTADSVSVKVKSSSAEKAAELLEEAVSEQEQVMESPSPRILYSGIEEDLVEIEAHYWMKDSTDILQLRSLVLQNYNDKAEKAGIYEESEE